MLKMIEFYHNKIIDMLKLGCTLPNLANICLHESTDSIFYPFTESDKDLLEKIREDMVGGASVVFTRKAVMHKTFIRKSSNLCKSIVGIDAGQLYSNSMCQPTLLDCIRDGSTILKLRDSQLAKTNLAPLKIWFCHTFNTVDQIANFRVISLLVDKKGWLFQGRWNLLSFYHCFWSYGLLLSLLSLSRSTSLSNRYRYLEGSEEAAAISNPYRLHRTKGLPNCWNVGVSVVESL